MSTTFNTRAAREMRSAFEARKQGALISETSEAKRLVFFENGELVGAKSNLVDDRLGAIMVRDGGITQAQLDNATEFIRSGRKLGQILVELGYLKGGEIENFVRVQILEIACAILLAPSNRLVFSEQVPVEAVTLAPVSIGDVFLFAVDRLPDIALYRENVLIEDYVLAQTDDALVLVSGMKLTMEQGTLLDLVDSQNTIRDIIAKAPLPEEETVRVLIALYQSGIVAFSEGESRHAPAPEAQPTPEVARVDPFEKELIRRHNEIQCQNHWEVLGLKRGAGHGEIDRAYRELFHELDEEKWEHISDSDFQERLSFVRARVKEAYITLSSRTSADVYRELDARETQYQETRQRWEVIAAESVEPEAWQRPKDTEEAARLFKRAKRAMREQDFWQCIELCRQAIEMDEDNQPERYHVLGCALAENPRWRQDAEQNLKIAHKLEPWQPRYLVSLGQLYEKEGLQERAERVYEQVRTIDPDFPIPKVDKAEKKNLSVKNEQAS